MGVKYVSFLVELNGLEVTPEMRKDIRQAYLFAVAFEGSRSLTALYMACGLPAVKGALAVLSWIDS